MHSRRSPGGRLGGVEADALEEDRHREAIRGGVLHHPVAEELSRVVEEAALRRERDEGAANAILAEGVEGHDSLVRRAVEHPPIGVELARRDARGDLVPEGRRVGARRRGVDARELDSAGGVALDRDVHAAVAVDLRRDRELDRGRDGEPAERAHAIEADGDALRAEVARDIHHDREEHRHGDDGVAVLHARPAGALPVESVVDEVGIPAHRDLAAERHLALHGDGGAARGSEGLEDLALRRGELAEARGELGGEGIAWIEGYFGEAEARRRVGAREGRRGGEERDAERELDGPRRSARVAPLRGGERRRRSL